MILIRFLIFLMTCLLSCVLLFAAPADAQRVTPIWEISEQKELGGELYQTAFLLEKMMAIGLTREQVVGIDSSGKVSSLIKLLPGQRANLSINGRFVSVMTIEREFIDMFELKTFDGEVVASIKPSGGFISFLVGRDAHMTVGVSVEKRPEGSEISYTYHFYDNLGKKIGQTKAVNPTGASPAPDGRAFVLNDPRAGLMAFAQDGSKLWGVDKSYRFFDVANGACRVIGNSTSLIKRVVLFEDGKPIGDSSFEHPVRNVAISPNGEFVVATDARTVGLFINQLQEAWKYTFEDESFTINSIAISDSGFMACGLLRDNGKQVPPESRYTKGQVFLFDHNGKIIWKETYNLSLSNAWIPIVTLTPFKEGRMVLTVRTREKLFLYTIEH